MSRTKKTLSLVVLSLTLALVPSLQASWVGEGVPVCTEAYDQDTQYVFSDGAGGAFIAWMDVRTGVNSHVYIQRVDAAGDIVWTVDGIRLDTLTLSGYVPRITTDGAGGAIVMWRDYRVSSYDLYAQRINGQGTLMWTGGGAPVCTSATNQYDAYIVSDDAGGAIIAWTDLDDSRTYAQRINQAGTTQWTVNGISICSDPGSQYNIGMAPDGAGGAFVVWEDYRNGSYRDIYMQRAGFNGSLQWASAGIAVCTANHNQLLPKVISDGAGGAIVTWHDYRSYNYNVYAQRFDASGNALWTTDGVAVCTASLHQTNVSLVSDGANGAIITWFDSRNGNTDFYAQRIDPSGSVQWTVDGIPVCTEASMQGELRITSDDAGGAILTWRDDRNSTTDIYAQRIDPSGTVMWTIDGVPVCSEVADQNNPQIAGDGWNGAIVAWVDERNGTEDIYTQLLDGSGKTASRPPVIRSVTDVPGDEGGRVVVAWNASTADVIAHSITEYTVWRAIELPPALAMIENGARLLISPAELAGLDPGETGRPVLRASTLYDDEFYWQLVGVAPAYYLEHYSYAAETLFDSTAVAWDLHYFQVIAHTADSYVYWTSDPDSGYSVDNLAPLAPAGLSGAQSYSPEGIHLTWDPNEETDVIAYSIYRGTSSDFIPAPGNYLASTVEEELFDDEWLWEEGYWYKINAVDVHGNEGPFALTGPSEVTGEDPMPVPDATFLSQNFPNPFNPATTIAFGLKEQGNVTLSIYDAAGRLVAGLINESRPAGQYAAVWNGKDRNGTSVASGVYFYRLNTNEFEETKKMILLR